MLTLSSPLGLEVPDRVEAKIWVQEYVNLWSLLRPLDEVPYTIHVQPSTDSHPSSISVAHNTRQKEITSISQWTDAFLVFVSVLAVKKPELTPDLMKYMSVIRNMEQTYGGYAWCVYDQRFRTLLPMMNLHWGAILWSVF